MMIEGEQVWQSTLPKRNCDSKNDKKQLSSTYKADCSESSHAGHQRQVEQGEEEKGEEDSKWGCWLLRAGIK